MEDKTRKVEIPKHLMEKRDRVMAEMERIASDPRVLEEAEEFHRKVSKLTIWDLFRPFDI